MIRLVLSVVIVAVIFTFVILPFMEKIRRKSSKQLKRVDKLLTSDVSNGNEEEIKNKKES